jgi:hypothetical protein
MGLLDAFKARLGIKQKEFAIVTINGKEKVIERIDSFLPNSIRLNGYAIIPETEFLTYQALNSILPTPEFSSMKIMAVSFISISENTKIYRAYLDFNLLNLNAIFIMVTEEGISKEVTDQIYFITLKVDFPQTIEDWEPYLNKGFGLGEYYYTKDNGDVYTRISGIEGENFSSPFVVKEEGILDPAGQKGWKAELSYHLYQRELSDGSLEYMLIEVIDSESMPKGVRYSVGINLPSSTKFIKPPS